MNHNPFHAVAGRPNAHRFAQAIIFKVLEDRFGAIPEELPERVRGITDLDRLGSIYLVSALCEDLEAFLAQTNLAISFPQKLTRITGPWVAGWTLDQD